MQRRLAEELRSLNFAKHAHAIPTRPVPGGVGYRDSIQKVVGVSVAATSASLVFPSSGYSTASSASISSAGSEVPTPSSGGGSYKILRVEAFRDLTEIASLMVNDGYTGGLITEFARGQRGSGGDAILGTWFSDLGVEWVLGANEMSLRELPWSAVEELIKKWVVALTVMAEALRLTWSGLRSDGVSGGGVPLLSKENFRVHRSAPAGAAPVSPAVSFAGSSDPDQESPGGRPHPTSSFDVATLKEAMVAYSLAEKGHRFNFDEQSQVALAGLESQFSVFAEASLMKMLGFPDAVASLESSPEKILRMIDIYSLVNDISPGLMVLLTGESKKLVSDRILSVLETMGHAVRRILNNLISLIQKEESWKSTVQPQLDDIHPVSQYVVTYINLLLENSTVLNLMMHGEDDMLAIEGLYHDSNPFAAEDSTSLVNIVGDLINTLDAMLEDRSKAYTAAGRRFIFLLNNANFVLQQGETSLQDFLGAYWSEYRKRGIDRHIRSYLNASWEPVISCLASNKSSNLMRGKNSVFRKVSVLVEFNSLFQITYRTEKLWKIKSPQLRSTLRKSVCAKVISAYKGYIERHAELTRSAINAPEDLEDMLQDLFEG